MMVFFDKSKLSFLSMMLTISRLFHRKIKEKILFGRQFYTRIYNELIYKRILFVISSIYDYYLRKKMKEKSFNKFWNFIKTITM